MSRPTLFSRDRSRFGPTPRSASRRRPRPVLVALALLAPAAATLAVVGSLAAAPPSVADAAPAPPVGPDRTELDRLITVFQRRAPQRDESADYRYLGSLLLQRATLDASVPDYRGAVDAYAAAIDLAPGETDGLLGLGRASLGIHDFATAGRSADQVLDGDPTDQDALALAVDAALATGRYQDAANAMDDLVAARPDDPAVLVRASQVALSDPGRPDPAARAERSLDLADQAVDLVESAGAAPADLAFHLAYAGRLRFDRGDHAGAGDRLERALDLAPDDQGILGELARVRAATGRAAEAIALLDRANALVPEPDHLFLQADLEAQAGDGAAAAGHRARGVELATMDADHRRAWARSLAYHHLDGGGDPSEGLRLAEAEATARSDVGALDLLAWARHRNGDLVGAAEAADRALATGVEDARASYHAGVIAEARGDDRRAVELVSGALALNPGFDPVSAGQARALLERLG